MFLKLEYLVILIVENFFKLTTNDSLNTKIFSLDSNIINKYLKYNFHIPNLVKILN